MIGRHSIFVQLKTAAREGLRYRADVWSSQSGRSLFRLVEGRTRATGRWSTEWAESANQFTWYRQRYSYPRDPGADLFPMTLIEASHIEN